METSYQPPCENNKNVALIFGIGLDVITNLSVNPVYLSKLRFLPFGLNYFWEVFNKTLH